MIRLRLRQILFVITPVLLLAFPLAAQGVASDTSKTKAPSPSGQEATRPQLDFSGTLFGNFRYENGPSNRNANAFTLDRAHLTFKMPAGERTSIRVTTDVFQDAGSNAYTVRAKYAYLQYDLPKFSNGAALLARVGIVHTVEIDHEENFWPRYLATTGVEHAGFFGPADGGIASQLTLPSRMGEIYAAVTNGPGYASRETDRFKDYQARLSLTPLMSRAGVPSLLRTFTLTGWTYRGAIASKFANGGAGQVGSIGEAMPRNRFGVLAGIRDPRLIIAGEWARATTGTETGANTVASPRIRTDVEGDLLYGFVVARPLAFINASGKSPFALIARADRYTPANNLSDYSYHFFVGGVSYDISSKATLALDYQEQLPTSGAVLPTQGATGTVGLPPTSFRTMFAHFVVNF